MRRLNNLIMKTFKQYFTESTEEDVRFKTLDDLLDATMEMLGDYGAYEANLRPAESVDRGVEGLQEYVEVYLDGLGLTDTDAEWYDKRQKAYQAIWDENARLNKELLGHTDKDEKEEQDILNQRYNAMILAAMHDVDWEDYVDEHGGLLKSKKLEGLAFHAAERLRKDWRPPSEVLDAERAEHEPGPIEREMKKIPGKYFDREKFDREEAELLRKIDRTTDRGRAIWKKWKDDYFKRLKDEEYN